MHVRSFACAVSAVALLFVAGPAALAHAGTADPCDAKLLAFFQGDDAFQSAQDSLTAAQRATDGANDSEKILQDADMAIREGILALPWTKASMPAQLNLGQAVRAYKSLYIKTVDTGPTTSAGDPSVAAQTLADAAQELVADAKLSADQGTIFVMKRLTQGVSDEKAAYALFLTIPARMADLAQATQQADKMQSGESAARTGLETCLQNAAGKS